MTNEERLDQLRTYYSTLSQMPITLEYDFVTTITDLPKFLNSHFNMVESNINKRAFLPYLERLERVKEILDSQTPPEPKTKKKRAYLRKSK